MRFTPRQYDAAIKSLQNARQQLEPDGHCCACCGDSGHQAFECGHNPLVAMAICDVMSKDADALHVALHDGSDFSKIDDVTEKLHDMAHYLGGHETYMGEVVGPARVHLPEE